MAFGDESYRSIFEFNRDGIFLFDRSGSFLDANPAGKRMSGYTEHEFLTIQFADLFAPDQRAICSNAFQMSLAGAGHEVKTAMVQKNGNRVDVWLTGGPIMVDGEITGLFSIAKDISFRKKAEKESIEDREEMAALLMESTARLHEEICRRSEAERQLRSLASALSMAEFNERERLAQVLHDNLQQILVGIKYRLSNFEKGEISNQKALEIDSLVDDALNIARSLTAELYQPALYQGLPSALEWLAAWMNQKLGLEVDLCLEPTESAPKEVEAFLFQSIRELLFNAAKHAKVSSARVRLGMRGQKLHVAVEDEGVGFDPAQIHFPSVSGGFGLIRIKERIALLGGKLEMSSSPGLGSRFQLSIPISY
jgi:PAS domain S-box-containing protein